MNPYFQEADDRFRHALQSLRDHGFEASQAVILDAIPYDPYRLEMREALAIHHASVKNLDRFQYHFLFCRSVDPSIAERLMANDVVVSAFGAEALQSMAPPKERMDITARRRFKAVDPLGDRMMLHFRPTHENEIESIYRALGEATHKYLNRHDEPVFKQGGHLLLDHGSDRVYSDASIEDLFSAFWKLGPHIEDVRFLMYGEQEAFVDEVIIQNGSVYFYRHDLEDDYMETRLEYFRAIATRYNDVALQNWVTVEHQKL